MKYFAYLSLVLLLSNCQSSVYSAKDSYSNGQAKYKGKYIECQTNDPAYPEIIVNEKRKFGEWKSYYPNGHLKEVRRYTENVKDCQTKVVREGVWEYYNQDGTLYLTEEYQNNALLVSQVDIYEKTQQIGQVTKSDFAADSVILRFPQPNDQLITNPGFERYYFQPIPLVNDGFDQIETLIPGWYSPDEATPDYYHHFRAVEGVPPHFQSDDDHAGGYIGLMLYLGKGGNRYVIPPDYTETVQTKLLKPLQKDSIYCLKMSIRLSDNAGYSINKLGALFSEKAVTFQNTKSFDAPSMVFNHGLDDQDRWQTLCESYRAAGGERFLSIGRFSSIDHMKRKTFAFRYKSPLNINDAAYYLLDEVALYPVKDQTDCQCETSGDPDKLSMEVDTAEFTIGNTIILNNILFAFDSDQLDAKSFQELGRLADYLKAFPATQIEITGHTDQVGNDAYNLDLSQKRANAVARWLEENGIDKGRIKAKGAGNQSPIDGSSPRSAVNRRVEILLTR